NAPNAEPPNGWRGNTKWSARCEEGSTGNWTALRIKSDIDCCRYQGRLSSCKKQIEGYITISIAYWLLIRRYVSTLKMDNCLCHYPGKATCTLSGQASINDNRAISIWHILRGPGSTAICRYRWNWRQLFLQLLVSGQCLLRCNPSNSGAAGRKQA